LASWPWFPSPGRVFSVHSGRPEIFRAIDQSREGHRRRRIDPPKIFRRCLSTSRSARILHATEQSTAGGARFTTTDERGGRGVAARGCAGGPLAQPRRDVPGPTAKAADPRRGSESERKRPPEPNGETEHRAPVRHTRARRGRLRVRASREAKPGRPPAVPAFFFFQRPPRSGGGGARSPPQVGGAVGLGHHIPGRGREGDGFGMSAAACPPPRPPWMPTPAWLARRTGCGRHRRALWPARHCVLA